MKQGSLRAVCLILMAILAVSLAFGDDSTVALESIILETFDGDSTYEWRAVGSRFATKTDDGVFPRVSLVATWPMALFRNNPEGKDLKSLGIWSNFDRRGYNWIDVYPVAKEGEEGAAEDAGATEIPIPGRVRYLDLWVWGSNLNYYIEVYLRDYQGVVHALNLGNIAFQGWKNLRVTVPHNVPQGKRVLPHFAGLSFVKFRIWTQPTEQVKDTYVYFDQFKVLTDRFESMFDGDELARPDKIQEMWGGGNSETTGSEESEDSE